MTTGMEHVESGEPTTAQCRNCRATWDASLNFCGKCGQRLRGNPGTIQTEVELPISAVLPQQPEAVGTVGQRKHFPLFAIALVCLLVVFLLGSLLASLYLFGPKQSFASSKKLVPPPATGVVWFYDVHGQGDGVGVRIRNLVIPPKGYVYVGWLLNPHRPDVLFPIKPLVIQGHGNILFQSEHDPSFNSQKQNLRLLFTQFILTMEPVQSSLQRPTGRTLLQGNINADGLTDLTQLFVSAVYVPHRSALLTGLRSQLGELERWVANMLDSQQVNDTVSVHADLLRLLYIIEGTNGADIARLNVLTLANITNEGDGFGLLSSQAPCQITAATCGYFDALRTTLHTLLSSGGVATDTMRRLSITLTDMEQWTGALREHLLSLVSFSVLDTSMHIALTQVRTLSDLLLNGIDRDGDGTIDPVAGEAGAAQLYAYMQQVGAIKLT